MPFVADFPFNQPTEPVIPRPKPVSLLRQILRFIGSVLQTVLFAAVLFFAVNLVTARIRVEGDSMEPSLHDGQFVVVSRLAYDLPLFQSEPQRGDIVVFRFPLNPERRFIKRIIGLPGDEVLVQDGAVYINGVQLFEPYLAVQPAYNSAWRVGQDEVIVLGDNRNNSSDSQNWGALPLEGIIGKAVLVYWPLENLGWIPHYDLAVAADD
jgi:signal peptidase I